MTLQAITLDVGNTLLFPHPSIGDVYAAVGKRHGMDLDPAPVEQAFRLEWARCRKNTQGLVYGTTHGQALHFWHRVNQGVLAAERLSDGALHTFVEDLYTVFGKTSSWRVNADLEPLLRAARSAGVQVGLISNWDARLRPLLQALSFTAWATPVLISAEAGVEKPDPALFAMALQQLDLDADAVLHVGDTWEDDVIAARRCGMRAAWYNPDNHPLPAHADHVLNLRALSDLNRLMKAP